VVRESEGQEGKGKSDEEFFGQCVHTLVRIKDTISSGTVFAVTMAINSVYGGTMKTIRRLLIMLCLAVLGGCYVDPALSGSYSVDVGVGTTYYESYPYYWSQPLPPPPPPRRYYWDDDWRYRRWQRERWYRRYSSYEP
jgi:hypothetical protein